MYFLIKENLVEVTWEDIKNESLPYVAVLTRENWQKDYEKYEMGNILDVLPESDTTKADVNFDSLTGAFSIPHRDALSVHDNFSFAINARGTVLIDDSGYVTKLIHRLQTTKRWPAPSLECFLYSFMEEIVSKDLPVLESYETRLNHLEERILKEDMEYVMEELNSIRGDLLDFNIHYAQFCDLLQEFEENENEFFLEKNLRYFTLLSNRLVRYLDQVRVLSDYSAQIRDLYQSQIDARQNKIMALLTIITTIFFPLSIITGWYGMNFIHMPELAYPWSYPLLFVLCLGIIVLEIIVFRKKKWM